MKFGRLAIRNFMSFRDASLDLQRPGLTLVDGCVIGSDSFTSNRAGKSNLFEALTWCLYGKTVKGAMADEIINNQVKKNCKVTVRLSGVQGEFLVTRTRKHDKLGSVLLLDDTSNTVSLTGASNADTQASIDNIMGMDYRSFINSVIFGQGNIERFSTASDRTRKEILEDLLGLSYIPKAQELMKARVRGIDSIESSTNLLLSVARLEQEKLKERIINESYRVENFRVNKIGILLDVFEELDEIKEEIFGLEASVLPFLDEDDTEKLKKTADDAKERLEEARREITAMTDPRTKLVMVQDKITDEDRHIRTLRDQIEGKENLVGRKCSVCGRKITSMKVHTSELEEEVSLRIDRSREYTIGEKEIGRDIISYKKLQDHLGLLNGIYTEAERELQTSLGGCEARSARLERLHKVYQTQVAIEGRLLVESRKKADVSEILKQDELALEIVELGILGLGERLDEIDSDQAYYEFWVEAFSNRGLKSIIIDSIIPFLNKQASLYSGILTDGEIRVEFVNEKKLRSGDTRDKLEVVSSSSFGGGSYKLISGGEKKRADLCQALALRDLVASRGGDNVDFLFLDECFESLDTTGTERVISLLDELVGRYGTVMVATHIEEVKDLFPSRVTIINTNGVSEVQDGES